MTQSVNKPEEIISGNSVRVLAAENYEPDLIHIKTVINNLLPYAGLISARDGAETIDRFKKFRPDIILIAVHMPDINGYDIAVHIRNSEGGAFVPIIAVTGSDSETERDRYAALGINDFVLKPVTEINLGPVFKKWLAPVSDAVTEEDTDIPPCFKGLSHLLAGDRDLIISTLSIAKKQLQSFRNDIIYAAEQADIKTLRFLGHKLYGTAATIGMEELASLAKTIEHLEYFDESVSGLTGLIRNEIETAMMQLEQYYPDM